MRSLSSYTEGQDQGTCSGMVQYQTNNMRHCASSHACISPPFQYFKEATTYTDVPSCIFLLSNYVFCSCSALFLMFFYALHNTRIVLFFPSPPTLHFAFPRFLFAAFLPGSYTHFRLCSTSSSCLRTRRDTFVFVRFPFGPAYTGQYINCQGSWP